MSVIEQANDRRHHWAPLGQMAGHQPDGRCGRIITACGQLQLDFQGHPIVSSRLLRGPAAPSASPPW